MMKEDAHNQKSVLIENRKSLKDHLCVEGERLKRHGTTEGDLHQVYQTIRDSV